MASQPATPFIGRLYIEGKGGAASSSGPNEIVAATADKRICVTGIVLTTVGATSALTAYFQSASGTPLWQAVLIHASGGMAGVADRTAAPDRLFQTIVGEALNLNLSGAVSVSYAVTYFLE